MNDRTVTFAYVRAERLAVAEAFKLTGERLTAFNDKVGAALVDWIGLDTLEARIDVRSKIRTLAATV